MNADEGEAYGRRFGGMEVNRREDENRDLYE
jgi:hypothetical protein